MPTSRPSLPPITAAAAGKPGASRAWTFSIWLVAALVSFAILLLAPSSRPGSWPVQLTCWVAALGAPLVLLLAAARSLFFRARRARRRAASYQQIATVPTAATDLRPGPVVMHGRVAYAEGASEAMRVELIALGAETQSKNSWSHTWTEAERTLTAQPFYLVNEGAPRVRVEARPETSQLFDTLEARSVVERGQARAAGTQGTNGKMIIDPPRRIRTAKLDRGEEVWVVGELSEGEDPEAGAMTETEDPGYRTNARATGWTLRAAPTLLVSSVPLAEHFRGRAAMHARHAAYLVVAMICSLLLLALWTDRAFGRDLTGEVVSVTTQHNKYGDITGYVGKVSVDGALWTSEPLARPPAKGTPFPLRIGRYTSNDGPGVHWTGGEALIALFAALTALFLPAILRGSAQRSLPWFRAEGGFVERGNGRLDLSET